MFCSHCGTNLAADAAFCSSCGAPTRIPSPASPAAPSPTPSEPATTHQSFSEKYAGTPFGHPVEPVVTAAPLPRRGSTLRKLVTVAVVVLVLGSAIAVADLVLPLSSGGGSLSGLSASPSPPMEQPPAGTVWFGPSWDTTSFTMGAPFTSVPAGQQVTALAQLSQQINDVPVVTYLDDGASKIAIATQPATTQEYDMLGLTVPAFAIADPGTYTVTCQDIGGNVLASGTLTVTAP